MHKSAAAPIMHVHSSLSEYADERIIRVHNISVTAPSSGKRKGFCNVIFLDKARMVSYIYRVSVLNNFVK
jgi:hypothetical protein